MQTIQPNENNFQNYRQKVKEVLTEVRAKYGIEGRFTDADFYRICESENIILLNAEDARRILYPEVKAIGFYVNHSGYRFIYMRSFFSRKLNLDVATHELGHHFLDHFGTNFKDKTVRTQCEKEANYFAYLATKAEARNV